MTEIALESDHPILFIYDVDNSEMLIPEYEGESLVAHNDSCVSVGMQVNTSGPTTVSLSGNVRNPTGALVFEGNVCAPSKSISVNTSERESWITIRVASDSARVKVWANDEVEPSVIAIEAV